MTVKLCYFSAGQNIITYEGRKETLLLSHLQIISRTVSGEREKRELSLKIENETCRNKKIIFCFLVFCKEVNHNVGKKLKLK